MTRAPDPGTPGARERRGRWSAAPVVVALVYVALRVLALHTAFDDLCQPHYELNPMGNLAKVVESSGWSGPPLYDYYDNCGGHLVTGMLGGLSFALFGDSYLALKLVPLVLGLATIGVLWILLDRHFGRRAAIAGVLLFALPVPTLAKYSMLAKGNHFESVFFQLLALLAFMRMHEREVSRGASSAFGLAAGLALFVYYGSTALLALLALTHACLRGPSRALGDLGRILPGFALGVAPLPIIALLGSPGPLGFPSAKLQPLFERPPGADLDRLRRFVAEIVPRASGFEDLGPLPAVALDSLFLAVFCVGWLLLAVRLARSLRSGTSEGGGQRAAARLIPFVGYLPLIGVMYAVTSFEFDEYSPPMEVGRYRYLVPHFALAAALLGVAYGGLEGRGRKVFGAALGLVLVATTGAFVRLVDWGFEHAGYGLRYDGYAFRYYALVMGEPRHVPGEGTSWDRERIAARLADLPPELRHQAYACVGYWTAWSTTRPSSPDATDASGLLEHALDGYPDDVRIDVARGVGSYLRAPMGVQRAGLRPRLAAIAASGHPLVPYVVEGLCVDPQPAISRSLPRQQELSEKVGASVPAPLRGAWVRGLGLAWGRSLRWDIPADVALMREALEALDPGERAEFWFGVGCAFGERREHATVLLASVPEEHRRHALTGLGAEARHVFGPEIRPELDGSSADDRAAVLHGLARPGYPAPCPLER